MSHADPILYSCVVDAVPALYHQYYVAAEHAPTIACLRLDALATHLEAGRPLRLIKIDVEGMELSVLRSGEQLLRMYRPLLYLEVVAAQLQRYGVTVGDIEAFLTRHGYVFFRNVGRRNSTNDEYQMVPVAALADGGTFFDCLAIPRERVSVEMTARAQST